jgi:hypothetical protein
MANITSSDDFLGPVVRLRSPSSNHPEQCRGILGRPSDRSLKIFTGPCLPAGRLPQDRLSMLARGLSRSCFAFAGSRQHTQCVVMLYLAGQFSDSKTGIYKTPSRALASRTGPRVTRKNLNSLSIKDFSSHQMAEPWWSAWSEKLRYLKAIYQDNETA